MKNAMVLLLSVFLLLSCNYDALYETVEWDYQMGKPDYTPPNAPQDITVTDFGLSSITIEWSPATDDEDGKGILGYNIYISDYPIPEDRMTREGQLSNLEGPVQTATEYNINHLRPGTIYWIGVTAVDQSQTQNESDPDYIIHQATEEMVNSWHHHIHSSKGNEEYTFNKVWINEDGSHGWIIGYDGILLEYQEDHWQQYYLGLPGVSLNDIYMLNDEHGWIVGDKGTILEYEQGEWVSNNYERNQIHLHSVFCLDEDTCWFGGTEQTLIKQKGEVRELVIEQKYDAIVNKIYMMEEDKGFAFTDHVEIFECVDGEWASFTLYLDIYYKPVLSGEIILLWYRNCGKMYEYRDETWGLIDKSEFPTFFNHLFMLDEENGWGIGYGNPNYFVYKKCGQWYDYEYFPPSTNIKDLHMLDMETGWAVGEDGVILHCTDSEWRRYYYHLTYTDLNAIHIDPDSNFGWAVGDQVILQFHNQQWSLYDSDGVSSSLNDVFTVSQNFAVCGTSNGILEYKDNTWQWVELEGSFYAESVHIFDEDNGWAAGWSGKIYKKKWKSNG